MLLSSARCSNHCCRRPLGCTGCVNGGLLSCPPRCNTRVVVAGLGVVEGGATGLVVRALVVTGEGRGKAVVVVRTVVFRVVVFTVVGRLVVRLVTGGKVIVLTVGRLVVEVVVSRLGVEDEVTS